MDVLVNKLVLRELKTARSIEQAHVAQLLNYLKATQIEVGLLLNFGPRPEFKRVVFGNERKAAGMAIGPSTRPPGTCFLSICTVGRWVSSGYSPPAGMPSNIEVPHVR